VVVEIALALVLLIGAGLMIRKPDQGAAHGSRDSVSDDEVRSDGEVAVGCGIADALAAGPTEDLAAGFGFFAISRIL
jgi:hypothetical protein